VTTRAGQAPATSAR